MNRSSGLAREAHSHVDGGVEQVENVRGGTNGMTGSANIGTTAVNRQTRLKTLSSGTTLRAATSTLQQSTSVTKTYVGLINRLWVALVT